ncbi:MAG TPA: metallopeptidase TldD-related protein [Candidatus Dormibacteraeota bacterium]|nr:metallopeptidase TldD-related protein [Candidatus Dormibacteraeota bacterium]
MNRAMTAMMTNARCLLLAWMILALSVSAAFGQKNSAAKDDIVLAAMRAELERSKSELKMDQVAAPYYVEYRIFDVDQYVAGASFGAMRADLRTRFRFLRVVVRIGDYKQDSYFGQGEGTLDYMPVDDDMLALRHQLWLATDRAYKAAAESLTAKQAQLKQLTVDQPVDDFAHADPGQSIGPLVKLEFDPEPWKKMLQDATALYKNDPEIESFESNLRFQAVNRYFVNSEGTVVRSGQNLYEMTVGCSTQAADGMSLARDNAFNVANIKELPSATEFVGRAEKLANSLKDLRNAPLVEEDYRGPVLFSADASASVFATFVGENVLGHKPELGKNARTTGAFASSYKTRVLPDFLSVVSDPTISEYRGQSLLGHYEIDDEGVRAQRVSVIEKGMLVNYLLGREPIRDFPASNGHARAQIPTGKPGPHNSNLIVTSSQPTPKDELKKKLIELCQQRDLPYCYYVETFGGRLTPRLLYKVWAKDGHEELVRGAAFGDLDIRSLRSDLIAAGDDVYVDSRPQNIPNSISAPSILFDELEVKRANQNKEKLPEYPAPAVSK